MTFLRVGNFKGVHAVPFSSKRAAEQHIVKSKRFGYVAHHIKKINGVYLAIGRRRR